MLVVINLKRVINQICSVLGLTALILPLLFKKKKKKKKKHNVAEK